MKRRPVAAQLRALALCLAALPALGSCAILNAGSYATESFLAEPDPLLAADALPAFIKVSQTLLAMDPGKQSNAVSLASLYLLYGTGYLEAEAYYLEDSDYSRWLSLRTRARDLYLRAMDLLEPFVARRSPGLFDENLDTDPAHAEAVKAIAAMLKGFGKRDAPLLYYTAASIFAAFSSNPLDFDVSARVPAAVVLMEKALSLDPDYGEGSIWELAFSVYASLPPEMGGGRDKALEAYRRAMQASGGLSAGLRVSYATLVCAPDGDRQGFADSLQAALALVPSAAPRRALLNAISRKKAERLLEQADMYFYDEEGGTDE